MAEFLEMLNITKHFPGVTANKNIDFHVSRGVIHALVGENGAGKSTLMRILYGIYRPDSGKIILDGRTVTVQNPQTAIRLGIGMVHQEFQLAPSLTAAENITLGYEPQRGPFVDGKKMIREVEDLSTQFGFAIPPRVRVSELSVGIQQRIEILKLLYRKARLLILDEPTAVLTPQEAESLFLVLERLRDEGHTIILITHKLKEVKRICQDATILRRGEVTGRVNVVETSEKEIVRLMVGRAVDAVNIPAEKNFGPPRLEVLDLKANNNRGLPALKNINFSIRSGEILGVAGVEGNGQSELVECICGLRQSTGRVLLDRKELSSAEPRQRRDEGLAVIPEDRRKEGLNLQANIVENLISTRYFKRPFSRFGYLFPAESSRFAQKMISHFDIRAESALAGAATLSGGNAQKVVIARELAETPKVLVVAHPTRGLDIAASQAVHRELLELRRKGTAVLMISADLDEILQISDRILVIYEGQIVGEFNHQDVSYEKLGLLMAGQKITPENEEDAKLQNEVIL